MIDSDIQDEMFDKHFTDEEMNVIDDKAEEKKSY